MNEIALTQFIYDIVDDAIEHVFTRFPGDYTVRSDVYRRLAEHFQELHECLEME